MEFMEQKSWNIPRNLFLHLLMIGSLYASVVGLLVLLFQYINAAFPDALSSPYAAILDGIRRAESVLLVVFPVFLFVSRLLERDFAADRARRASPARKWLIYFTLFLAAVTIIVDLIILIYNFLGGDLRAQFFLKIAAVLAVAAAVFGYYFWELRRQEDAKTTLPRSAAIGSATVILAAVIAGFFIVGSPATQRARRFDDERVSHLQMIQNEVIAYWARKDALPETLDALRNEITGFVPPADPETDRAYEYRAAGPLSFELCAIFRTDQSDAGGRYHGIKSTMLFSPDAIRSPLSAHNQVWSHPAGPHCFSRAIDPTLYRSPKPAFKE